MVQLRDRIIAFLDGPRSKWEVGTAIALLILIYISVALLVFEFRYSKIAADYYWFISLLNHFILVVFGVEILIRLTVYRHRFQYLTSFYGIIDVLAVAPGLLTFAVPELVNLSWLRVLRIIRLLRFLRLVKFAQYSRGIGSILGGTIQRLLPPIALAAGFKGVLLAGEAQPWWPNIGGLGVVLTVTGFAISVLLGAKLSIVQSRFYDVEDAICRILGSITDMKKTETTREPLKQWVLSLRETIHQDTELAYRELKEKTAALEQILEENNISGPVTAGFHRDIEFLIHRLRARTPPFLDRFLYHITIAYASVAILAIPGFVGFCSVLLIIFVLGGMYLLIDDMNTPLATDQRSMISIDLTPLDEYASHLDDEEVFRKYVLDYRVHSLVIRGS